MTVDFSRLDLSPYDGDEYLAMGIIVRKKYCQWPGCRNEPGDMTEELEVNGHIGLMVEINGDMEPCCVDHHRQAELDGIKVFPTTDMRWAFGSA